MSEKPVILVVDDTPLNLVFVSDLLRTHYKVKVAINGEKALAIAAASPPDLILLDIMMPVMDGYETCQRLKQDTVLKDIPVIFLTARDGVKDEEKGFALGAVDYILKPISPPLLLARIKTHLTLKLARDFLRDKNVYLEAEVARRVSEVSRLQEVSIAAMASLAETRDNETGMHVRRTQYYLGALAEELRKENPGDQHLAPECIDWMIKSAPLHDIGKVGIPDHILLKPGRLTDEEFAIMKTHAALGRDAISRAEAMQEGEESFLHFAKEIAYSHHEKWDGSGYPEGIKGAEIPLSGRLMAVADVYDALICKRVYKEAMEHAVAIKIIEEGAGEHFDPLVIKAFSRIEKEFLAISRRYPDG